MSKARQLAQKPTQPTGRKNLIINGAMQVAQRGTTFDETSGDFCLDRFRKPNAGAYTTDPTFTVTQGDGYAAKGFNNSLKITVDTAASGGSNLDITLFSTRIEAQDLAPLSYGNNAAKTATLSFYVKSSVTGTFGIFMYNLSSNKEFITSYVVNSANTWERKEITIPSGAGALTSTDNNEGCRIEWRSDCSGTILQASNDTDWKTLTSARSITGNVNFFQTASNTFEITGIQLEVGSVATEFEHRSFGEELALCQRYYQIVDLSGSVANRWNTNYANIAGVHIYFPTEMRGNSSFSSLTTLTSRNLYNLATDLFATSGGMTASINFTRSRAVALYLGSASGSLSGSSGDPLIISGGELLAAFDAEL